MQDGVVGAALEVIAISEVRPLLEGVEPSQPGSPFSSDELAYARGKRDPERRLAARLAAKRAALRLLGAGFELRDAEIRRGRGGPPQLLLSERARRRLLELGGERALVSLSHGREHAAAAVLFVKPR
jgi:holo-[acyl-carrier protein] synthase